MVGHLSIGHMGRKEIASKTQENGTSMNSHEFSPFEVILEGK
jgi:hypothetical protein